MYSQRRDVPGNAIFPEPLAAKVPEITFLFWVVKILTTCGGEAVSDYLAEGDRLIGGAVEVSLLVIGLVWQFRTRRYSAVPYWFLAYAIAIFGTGVSDGLHLFVGIPYTGTTILWAVVLALIFWLWYRSEGTLSIHSITTRRREMYYWAVVFATFALGTALGDFTGTTLGLGYLASGIMFFFIILIPAVAWSRFGLNSIAAFWFAYVVTRPLGASFADYFGRPRSLSGLGFGSGRVAVIVAILVAAGVAYLAVTRRDIQRPEEYADVLRRIRKWRQATRNAVNQVPGVDKGHGQDKALGHRQAQEGRLGRAAAAAVRQDQPGQPARSRGRAPAGGHFDGCRRGRVPQAWTRTKTSRSSGAEIRPDRLERGPMFSTEFA